MPSLAGHHVVAEGVLRPDHPDLRPYLGKKPLLHFSQYAEVDRDGPVFEVAVFEDGNVFFEGGRCARAQGLHSRRMAAEDVKRLVGLLDKQCERVRKSSNQCSHGSATLSVACVSAGRRYRGTEGCGGNSPEGRWLFQFVATTIRWSGVKSWIGGDPPEAACTASDERYTPNQIRKTITPVHWKRYQPNPAGPPTKPGNQ